MNTEEYKSQLTALLRSLPQKEREEAVSFYMESIADRIDEGMSEEEAVAMMASPGQGAGADIAEAGEKKNTRGWVVLSVDGTDEPDFPENIAGIEATEDVVEGSEAASTSLDGFFARAKERRFTPLEWVVLIVTSPLWLTLLVAVAACTLALAIGVAAIVLALYICAWTLIACLWIIGGAFVVSAPAALLFVIWGLQTGNIPFSLVNTGYALLLFGGGMWVLKSAFAVTRAFLRWQKENVVVRFSRHGSNFAEETGPVDASSATNRLHYVGETSMQGDGDALKDGAAVEVLGAPFFRICWILALAGLACVLVGFLASGLDWRVFLTSNFSHGKVYLGGMEVACPEQLFLSPLVLDQPGFIVGC